MYPQRPAMSWDGYWEKTPLDYLSKKINDENKSKEFISKGKEIAQGVLGSREQEACGVPLEGVERARALALAWRDNAKAHTSRDAAYSMPNDVPQAESIGLCSAPVVQVAQIVTDGPFASGRLEGNEFDISLEINGQSYYFWTNIYDSFIKHHIPESYENNNSYKEPKGKIKLRCPDVCKKTYKFINIKRVCHLTREQLNDLSWRYLHHIELWSRTKIEMKITDEFVIFKIFGTDKNFLCAQEDLIIQIIIYVCTTLIVMIRERLKSDTVGLYDPEALKEIQKDITSFRDSLRKDFQVFKQEVYKPLNQKMVARVYDFMNEDDKKLFRSIDQKIVMGMRGQVSQGTHCTLWKSHLLDKNFSKARYDELEKTYYRKIIEANSKEFHCNGNSIGQGRRNLIMNERRELLWSAEFVDRGKFPLPRCYITLGYSLYNK
tara:strand:- start:625 stop:1926 length:1302 start_codon:yes stop_codon:yes gene_type:complete